jgi:hypothetical protein
MAQWLNECDGMRQCVCLNQNWPELENLQNCTFPRTQEILCGLSVRIQDSGAWVSAVENEYVR